MMMVLFGKAKGTNSKMLHGNKKQESLLVKFIKSAMVISMLNTLYTSQKILPK